MTKKTHIAAGVAVTLPILSVLPLYAAIGVIGSTLPDVDIFAPGAHRKITHSIIALLTSSCIIAIFNVPISIVYGINYLMHLLLDSFTKTGIPFLYPFIKKYYGPKLIRTGEAEDLFLCLIIIYLIILVFA